MKNLFKKKTNKNIVPSIEKLEKTQLNKIVGGAEEGIRPATGPSVGRPGTDAIVDDLNGLIR